MRYIINKTSSWIFLFVKKKKETPKITEEDIKHAIDLGQEIGELEFQEKTMINRIFKFNDLEVGDILCPINKVFSLNEKEKINKKLDLIIKKGYSRIPVYRKTKKHIVGVLFIKDILKEKNSQTKIKKLMRNAIFVHENKKIDDMLNEFKRKKTHLAIVNNSKGKFIGIVSIEDVLEKLVGKIYDETDNIPQTKKE